MKPPGALPSCRLAVRCGAVRGIPPKRCPQRPPGSAAAGGGEGRGGGGGQGASARPGRQGKPRIRAGEKSGPWFFGRCGNAPPCRALPYCLVPPFAALPVRLAAGRHAPHDPQHLAGRMRDRDHAPAAVGLPGMLALLSGGRCAGLPRTPPGSLSSRACGRRRSKSSPQLRAGAVREPAARRAARRLRTARHSEAGKAERPAAPACGRRRPAPRNGRVQGLDRPLPLSPRLSPSRPPPRPPPPPFPRRPARRRPAAD